MRSRLHEVARIRITALEASTASDHRTQTEPRGTVLVSDRMRAVARQRAEGVPTADLAALYGVSRKTISEWCLKVRWAAEDARHLVGIDHRDSSGR